MGLFSRKKSVFEPLSPEQKAVFDSLRARNPAWRIMQNDPEGVECRFKDGFRARITKDGSAQWFAIELRKGTETVFYEKFQHKTEGYGLLASIAELLIVEHDLQRQREYEESDNEVMKSKDESLKQFIKGSGSGS